MFSRVDVNKYQAPTPKQITNEWNFYALLISPNMYQHFVCSNVIGGVQVFKQLGRDSVIDIVGIWATEIYVENRHEYCNFTWKNWAYYTDTANI